MAEKIRVLIIEDDAIIARALESTLVEEGIEVVGAASRVSEALQRRPGSINGARGSSGAWMLPI